MFLGTELPLTVSRSEVPGSILAAARQASPSTPRLQQDVGTLNEEARASTPENGPKLTALSLPFSGLFLQSL